MTDKLPCSPMRLLALVATTFLVSCAAPPSAPTPQPAATPDIKGATKNAENNWLRCLNRSYPVTRTETADKNAAAEMALQNCYAEERVLAAITDMVVVDPNISIASIASLRSAAKAVLIDKGQVKLVE